MWTFPYREMLMKTAGGGEFQNLVISYRGMLIKTGGGGKFQNLVISYREKLIKPPEAETQNFPPPADFITIALAL